MLKQGWIWIVVVVVILIVGYLVWQSPSSYTVYPVFCQDWANNPPATEDFADCHQPFAYARETFVVNQAKNQITETSPDNSDFYTLNSCTIQDSEHWGCGASNDTFGDVSPSRSGDSFSENGVYGTPTDTIFVTESQWDSINNSSPSPDEITPPATTTPSTDTSPSAP